MGSSADEQEEADEAQAPHVAEETTTIQTGAVSTDADETATPASEAGGAELLDFGQALIAAKTLYFQGDERAEPAFEQLRLRIAAGDTPPVQLQAEALIYLGELYYQNGRTTDAKIVFNHVLTLDPDFPISPYEHPMEVVGMFEMLRRGITRPPPAPAAEPKKRLPAWGYLPFGVSQFRQGRRRQGVFYACMQGVLATTSVVAFAHLHNINGGGFPASWSDQEVQRRVQLARYGIQWPATIGFYAVWGASVYEGGRSWNSATPATASRPTVQREGLHLTLHYDF